MKNLQLTQQDGIAKLVFDRPNSSANIFDAATLLETQQAIETVAADASIKALIIRSAKSSIFIAGADIPSLSNASPGDLSSLIDLGHAVFNQIADLKIPTVAAIHGACLGGGYEIALACDWRIATEHKSTKIGLPETQLGILPAWGGTTRLSRLLTLPKALPLILAGKTLNAGAAKRKGLIDVAVHPAHLLNVAKEFTKKGKRKEVPHTLVHNLASVKMIESTARKDLMNKTQGLYPAPLKALEVACQSVSQPLQAGFKLEKDAIITLASKAETKHLIGLFLESEKAKKQRIPGMDGHKIQSPVIIGSGIMGAGITYWLSSRGYSVLMQDIDDQALAKGMHRIHSQYQQAQVRHIISLTESHAGMDRIYASSQPVNLMKKDLIIEAAVEALPLKQKIFTDLSQRCREDCILATNTSALPIQSLAESIKNPERVVGLHFFNPVHRMPLVEIVRAPSTSDATLSTALQFVQKIGKTPVIVKDSPGFLVNRVLVPYLLEACKLFANGMDPKAIDQAMLEFGMPMGPLRLLDEVGLDVGKHVAETLIAAYSDRMSLPPMMESMIEQGCLGRKVGKGFYVYGKEQPEPNPLALQLQKSSGQIPQNSAEFLAELMSNEAARCLDEGIVESAEAIDLAMVLGTGYAPFRGGPLHYADESKLIRPKFFKNAPPIRMAG